MHALEAKLRELSVISLQGKDTIKRNILCDLLGIPKDRSKKFTNKQIKEAILPKCIEESISLDYYKNQLLCEYFNIPVNHKPNIDTFIKPKLLEVLVQAYPKPLSTLVIAEISGETTGKVSTNLCTYRRKNDPWFEAVKIKGQKGYEWKATEAGVQAYRSGEAYQLKHTHSHHSTSKRPRRCTPKVAKVITVLAESQKTLTTKSIIRATKIDYQIIYDILEYDKSSKKPFFESVIIDEIQHWGLSIAGIDYYLKHIRTGSKSTIFRLEQQKSVMLKLVKQKVEKDQNERIKQERDMLRDKVGIEKYYIPDTNNPIDQEILRRIRDNGYSRFGDIREERLCRNILLRRLYLGSQSTRKERLDAAIFSGIEKRCKRYNKGWNETVRELFQIEFNIKTLNDSTTDLKVAQEIFF